MKPKNVLESFADVVHNFLGNMNYADYKNIVERMLTASEAQGCNMNLKVHFLHSHLVYFPESVEAYSEEQKERIHQDLRTMKMLKNLNI